MTRIPRRTLFRKLFFGGEGSVASGAAHTLVSVFLRGGADTLNMLVPYGDDAYYRLRPTLSIPAPSRGGEITGAAIRLDDFYACHPQLAPLTGIFHEGRLGFVQAVGTDNPTGSHFEAQDQMEHGEAYSRAIGGGWLGRYLTASAGARMTPLSAIAIGPTIPESLRGAPSASAIRSLEEIQLKSPAGDVLAVSETLARMYGAADVGVLSEPGRETLDLLERVERLRGQQYKTDGGAVYPNDEFGAGLREIARLIKAQVGLEAACIDLGGWDTHFLQGGVSGLQAEQIKLLAQGLAAFDADLRSHRESVTTIIMTEFGRRVYENSSLGTDHGRGFALMAIGGRINGGKIHGVWPGLEEDDVGFTGPGGMKVTTDYRSVLSELLAGVMGNRSLDKVFPDFHPDPVGLVKSLGAAVKRGPRLI